MAAATAEHGLLHRLPNLFVSRDERRRREACYPFDEMPPQGYVVIDLGAETAEQEFEEYEALEAAGLRAAWKNEGIRK